MRKNGEIKRKILKDFEPLAEDYLFTRSLVKSEAIHGGGAILKFKFWARKLDKYGFAYGEWEELDIEAKR